ncbi:MAG: DMT family transporter [Deltaproteobacteria bacterium]|nr:DMT family transporter [Deltaproteobacteria bacterium]
MSNKFKARALILTSTFIWGFSFPITRYALSYVDPVAFCGLRGLFGALVFLPVAMRLAHRGAGPGGSYGRERPRLWLWAGMVSGLVLTLATVFQYMGLSLTTSAKSGLLTGLYVTMVPLFGFVLGQLPPRTVWAGLFIGVVGLVLLSGAGGGDGFNRGDALTLVGDLFWALHVILMGHFALKVNPWNYVAVQIVIMSVICLTFSYLIGTFPAFSAFMLVLPCSSYGVLSVALAFLFQFKAQKDVNPTEAALLMQLQSVIAAIAGVLFLSERMTGWMWIGAFLMIVGSLVAQRTCQTKMLLRGMPHFREYLYARAAVAILVVSLCGVAVLVT